MLLFSAACVLFSHGETERERVVCVCACEARVFNENRNDDYCGEITTPREEILELVASSSLGHVCLFFFALSCEFRVFVFFSLVWTPTKGKENAFFCRPTKKRACASKKTSGAPLLFLSLSLSLFARACVCVYFYACVCVSSFYSIVCSCVCVCVFVFLTFLSSQKAAS